MPGTAIVARFTDASPYVLPSQFTATMNWGNGQTVTAVVQSDGNGGFLVIATGTLPNPGTYSGQVKVTHSGGATASAAVSITYAPLSPSQATISGNVFNDLNTDGLRENGEPALFAQTIFLDLNNNGVPDPGEPLALSAADGSYTLANVPEGNYMLRLAAPAGYQVTTPIDSTAVPISVVSGQIINGMDLGAARLTTNVVGRHVFYNNSALDGNNPAASASDDAAIAPDKQALRPGHTASAANLTSFTGGLNGIMVDISNLPGIPTAADFAFTVGSNGDPSTWQAAPPPSSFTVRQLPGHVTRVTIIWPDNAIQNEWLQVTVKANPVTGLSAPDVFYFGNLVGDTGGGGTVGFSDLLLLAQNYGQQGSAADINRDGQVDFSDLLILAQHYGNSVGPLSAPALNAPPLATVALLDATVAGEDLQPLGTQHRRAVSRFPQLR